MVSARLSRLVCGKEKAKALVPPLLIETRGRVVAVLSLEWAAALPITATYNNNEQGQGARK